MEEKKRILRRELFSRRVSRWSEPDVVELVVSFGRHVVTYRSDGDGEQVLVNGCVWARDGIEVDSVDFACGPAFEELTGMWPHEVDALVASGDAPVERVLEPACPARRPVRLTGAR